MSSKRKTSTSYTFTGTEEFLNGTKVKYNKSPLVKFELETTQPEKYAIINLTTGNVGYLHYSEMMDRVLKRDSDSRYACQEESLLVFCLNYVAEYAKKRGHWREDVKEAV